ncbi:hypothetical protein BVY04_02105 [bacterium M21]|nr:hypothetical protein BVY04_02105 [bacterium M21]
MVSIDDCMRLENYLRNSRGEHVAFFDIGTRAVRLLVGPKHVPVEEWRRNSFCNLGQILNLGDDLCPISQTIDLAQSRKMQELYDFMRTLKGILEDHNLADADVSAIGTAVFRWLENQPDVLEEIEREAGIRVNVLSAADEAMLTLQAIGHTYPFRHNNAYGGLSENDAILLLDQGGGSMEVSYLMTGRGQEVQTHTFDGLGTIALRQEFFDTDDMESETWVADRIAHIQEFIASKINSWEGYSEVSEMNLHAYGMGAAITNCVSGSNYSIHNQVVDCQMLLEDAGAAVAQLASMGKQLRHLGETLHERESGEYLELERLLDRVYGPPVYVRVLKKFGLSHLRICGYGLRYGAYVWQNYIGRSLADLSNCAAPA